MVAHIPDDVLAERAMVEQPPDPLLPSGGQPGSTIPDEVLSDEDAAARLEQEAALGGTDAQPVDLDET